MSAALPSKSNPEVGDQFDLPKPTWISNGFTDDVWHALSAEGYTNNINFLKIPEAFRLTCKYLLWEVETDTRFVTRRLTSTATLRVLYYDFRRLAIFLHDREISSLALCTEAMLLDFVKIRKGERERRSATAAIHTGVMLERLYWLGPKGAGRLPDGLLFEFTAKRVLRLMGAGQGVNETPILHDDTMRQLVNSALNFIEKADAICRCYEIAVQFLADPRYYNPGATTSVATAARMRFIRDQDFRTELDSCLETMLPLQAVLVSRDLEVIEGDTLGGWETADLIFFSNIAYLQTMLTASCFIVIAVLTGFRSGEVLSIGPGAIRRSGVGVSVASRITKNMERHGGVQIERPGPLILLDVDHVLQTIAKSQGVERYWQLGGRGMLRHLSLTRVISDFASSVACIDDADIKSRYFRRYFAIFFIRRFQGPEDALRRAFRHTTTEALGSYVRDRLSADYLVEAKQDLAREIYMDIAFERGAYSAIGQSAVVDNVVEYKAANLPVTEIEKQIFKALSAEELAVWPTLWGYCMLHKDDSTGAKCGGESGIPSALEMYPGNCGRCRHLVVGRANLGFWKGTRDMHAEIVENTTVVPYAKKASTMMVRIAEAIMGRF